MLNQLQHVFGMGVGVRKDLKGGLVKVGLLIKHASMTIRNRST